MSRLYDDLSKTVKENPPVPRSNPDLHSEKGGCHQFDVGGSTLKETVKFVERVFVFPNSHAPRVIVFSSVEGSGSSQICYLAGEVLAAQGSGSVCLVDANLRSPLLHQLLGLGKCPGLVEATVKPGPIKNFAVHIGDGNFWIVPPGTLAVEAQGLFASDRLRSRIADLKEEFDYVLIDAPPVSSHADAVLLGQMADGIILVVEANSTRREAARTAKEALENAQVKLLGAILNNRTFPIPEALYRKL
jgi:Mrp family chromosome partitioning ATPase